MQVVLNLLSNVVKFTIKGTIKISIFNFDSFTHQNFRNINHRESENLDGAPEKIVICVQDTGIGIKDYDKNKLFRLYGKINSEIN